ncbi:protein yellow-like [Liolophura sinensis]|uniref:protein yellow-like n=1 Tax=Liolophura sinensis TaxID=3198878 RepID=UPI0031581DAA
MKVYKDEVYVTVPQVVSRGCLPLSTKSSPQSSGKSALLQPFPSWENHTIGDCKAFQFVQAIEIEPSRGLMFVVDTGRSGVFDSVKKNSCPAKIVIIDIDKKTELGRYTFPEEVASQTENYLNDIVLDYFDNQSAYAYITDTGKPGIVVFDLKGNTSYRFEDAKTMSSEADKPSSLTGYLWAQIYPSTGYAMSADFRYAYFSAVTGTSLYQVPTSALRDPKTNITTVIRKVGDKPSQSDGLIYAQKNLYFGGLNDRSLYRWEVSKDVKSAGSEGNVALVTTSAILKNVSELTWGGYFCH